MYRSILVPLDGTPFGEHAVPVACGIARRFGCCVHLVRVHTQLAVPVAPESLPFLAADISLTERSLERAYLEELATRLRSRGVRVATSVVDGPLTESLEAAACECSADLIVACTHAHEGLARLWHRGVGEQLLRDLDVPVLLVRPPEAVLDPCVPYDFRHLLVPLDGSRFAEEILEPAVEIGRALGARVTLLRVVGPANLVGPALIGQEPYLDHVRLEEQQQEAGAYLARVAERVRKAGVEVSTRVEAMDDPAHAILEVAGTPAAGAPPIDLIAMATHGRGGLSRIVSSSVAGEVLRRAPVPMLLHRPPPPSTDLLLAHRQFVEQPAEHRS